jgi:Flp pilus assembly protein TadG
VEFAVVASVFFVIVLGIIELGRGFMVLHLLTNAAREGARTGVIEGKTTADINSTVTTALKSQGVKVDKATVQVNRADQDAAKAKQGDAITVVVSVPVGDVTWMPGGSFLKGSLTGKYTLRRE